MNCKIIDIDRWERKEYFEHYLSLVPCTYSVTVKLDITNLINKGVKLYPTMLYLLTKAVNKYEQFRMAFNDSGQLVVYDVMNPCYTVFHKGSETFSNIWTSYSDDYAVFCNRYQEDIGLYGNQKGFMGKPDIPENCFTISMIPWTAFEAFNINTSCFRYLKPIFTIGRYVKNNERCDLPLAVQVHHSVCDGFHVCRFINELQTLINNL